MTVEFECRTALGLPPEEVFERSRSIDLHVASMARSRERAVGGVTSGPIGLGEQVTWRAWHFGIPFTMTSRITEMDAPHWFVDEQVRGPFRSFRHEHAFVPNGPGTLMVDHVVLEAPIAGPGGLSEFVLGRYMLRLIERRNAHLAASAR